MSNIKLAGTFWSALNTDTAPTVFIDAWQLVEEQTHIDQRTLQMCLSLNTTPLYRTVLLTPLTLIWTAGQTLTWNIPGNISAVELITERINNAVYKLQPDIDYIIEREHISFNDNPFYLVNNKPAQPGDKLTLWLHHVNYDMRYLANLWGSAFDVMQPSSEDYRHLLKILYEATTSGATQEHITQLIELILGPCIFHESYETIESITIPANILDKTITGPLTFNNQDIPIQLIDDCVIFDVGGTPSSVARFWQLFNTKTPPAGQQLTTLLRGCTTINPCKFVWENVLKQHTILYTPVTANANTPLSDVQVDDILRKIAPPELLVLAVK